MILVIRISGLVEVPPRPRKSLEHMNLRRKYSAVLIKNTKENMKLLSVVRNFVAYGTIDSSTLSELISKRAQPISGKKVDAKTIIENIEKKDFGSLGIKPFFRLHPPRGGIDSKIHFGRRKGVLGDNKESINALVRRML